MSRITAIVFDLPYPADSGGRLDIWSQLNALRSCEYEIQLICFSLTEPEPLFYEKLGQIGLTNVVALPFIRSRIKNRRVWGKVAHRLLGLFSFLPPCVADTLVPSEELPEVVKKIREHASDVILVHGIQSAGLYLQLRSHLPEIPWLYRSHNHETKYFFGLFLAESHLLRKMNLLHQWLKVSWFEPRILRRAGAVLHISLAEQQMFLRQGYQRQIWMPPVYSFELKFPVGIPIWDLGVLSSWFASQKQEGLKWFAEKVRPLLPAGWRIAIAGSGSPDWMPEWCLKNDMIFVGLVDSPNKFYERCSVIMNPVLRGAGVNMKTMEILASGCPLVSTTAGLAGLPAEVISFVSVGDNPEEFSNCLLMAHSSGGKKIPRELFDHFSVEKFNINFKQALALSANHIL